jgi:hypothetical protein
MSKNGVMREPGDYAASPPGSPGRRVNLLPGRRREFLVRRLLMLHKKTARERAVEVGKATVGLVVAFLLDDRLFFFGMRHRKYVDVISLFDDGLAAVAVVLLNDRRVLCFHR